MKSFWLIILVFFGTIFGLSAQSNEIMDKVLAQKSTSFKDALYFSLIAANIVSEDVNYDDVLKIAKEKGFAFPMDDKEINMGDFADLVMQTFKLKGGLMYSIFSGPRYALRELTFKKIILGKPDLSTMVRGDDLLRVIGKAAAYIGEDK